jgi:hypothetical protein
LFDVEAIASIKRRGVRMFIAEDAEKWIIQKLFGNGSETHRVPLLGNKGYVTAKSAEKTQRSLRKTTSLRTLRLLRVLCG